MMKDVLYKELSKPKLKNPILVQGLPGFGQVGRLAAEHMIKELKAVKFAELISPSFPPEVFIDKDGVIRLIKNEFYSYKKGKAELIIVLGDSQATDVRGQYELSEAILEVIQKYGVKTIFTMGGYATGVLKEKPTVFGAATDSDLVKKYEKYDVIFRTDTERGSIVGVSGLVLGLGALKGIQGVCLMGETPGHPLFVDARSAEAVLQVLSKILGVKMSMAALEKRAEEIEKFRATIQEMIQKSAKGTEQQSKGTLQEQLRYIG
jgi:uncharacterized protein